MWLGLHAFTAEGLGSISGQGTKIPKAKQGGQKKKHALKKFLIPKLELSHIWAHIQYTKNEWYRICDDCF